MKLSDLMINCPEIPDSISDSILTLDILDITSDSREVKPGTLFIAIKGLEADGHDYMEQAFQNGAAVILAQENPNHLDSVILVKNTRACMGILAANLYGHPSKDMTLIGITGTNGKTTITWLLESIFSKAGFNTGVIGTINIRYNGQSIDNPMTTPDAVQLQKVLKQMKTAGITHVIMEVSSHGLDLNRVDGCRFDVGVFTNLTQDHLDYHSDMEDYFSCKKQLFTRFLSPDCPIVQRPENPIAVLNIDDPSGLNLFNTISYTRIGVSTKKSSDIHSTDIIDDINGLSGKINLPDTAFEFGSNLTGRFNLENILCAVAVSHGLNIEPAVIQAGIETCTIIPGRLEKVPNTIERHIFVDYAHTPDALESILTALKSRTPKRLISVFGCGGDRDTSKRPLMGHIAVNHSDIAIVTSDNPRTENPDTIITDILEGMQNFDHLSDHDIETTPFKKGFCVEPDRKKALSKAISISKPGDTIIAAGKGHETYQITNTGTIHFDDVEELTKATQSFQDHFAPMDWSIKELCEALAVDPIVNSFAKQDRFSSINTDSRTIKTDQVFLALKGDNFDGHTFIEALIEQGIKGFIVEQDFTLSLEKGVLERAKENALLIFEVARPLIALGQLARYQRLRSKVKLVAVTGSSGKTTTRKLIEGIFKSRFHTHATKGNFNNEIGVPLTLLNLSANHEWAIIEMGMNHAGEISRLSQMAIPDIALITNTAGVHLEGLKSVKNVAKAKAEIFDGVQDKAIAILFDRDQQKEIIASFVHSNTNIKRIIYFGSSPHADVQATNIKQNNNSIEFSAHLNDPNRPVSYPIIVHSPARFMVDNALAAIAVATNAGIDSKTIEQGIKAFQPVSGRMNIYPLAQTIQMIDDVYNANPSSLSQALETLAQVSKGQTSIAIIGDMLELGEQSADLHFQIGQRVAALGIHRLFLFGTQVEYIQNGAIENNYPKENIIWANKNKIIETVIDLLTPHTWILVKGSRGMAMEKVIQGLKENINDIF